MSNMFVKGSTNPLQMCPKEGNLIIRTFEKKEQFNLPMLTEAGICFSSEKLPSSDPRLQSAQNGSVILVPRFVNTKENHFGSLLFDNGSQKKYYTTHISAFINLVFAKNISNFVASCLCLWFHDTCLILLQTNSGGQEACTIPSSGHLQ